MYQTLIKFEFFIIFFQISMKNDDAIKKSRDVEHEFLYFFKVLIVGKIPNWTMQLSDYFIKILQFSIS